MKFTCPYCGAEIEKSLFWERRIVSGGRCKCCKRKYILAPVAFREDDPRGRLAVDEQNGVALIGLVVAVAVAVVIILLRFLIAR